ncbi:MAG: hypothetical protein ACRDY1_10220 [Acidimicrobiales bacterium]
MAGDRRWIDGSQPQTLQGAVLLCYITAVFGLLGLLIAGYPAVEVIPLGLGVAGFGVANEKKWGYWLGVVLAGLNLLVDLYITLIGGISFVLTLLFAVVLLGLFLHAQSRAYERIWFH